VTLATSNTGERVLLEAEQAVIHGSPNLATLLCPTALTNAGWKVKIDFDAAAGTITNGPVTLDITVQGSALGFKSDTPTNEDLDNLPRHVISLKHFNIARVLKELSTMKSEGGDTAANFNSATTGHGGETAQAGPATTGAGLPGTRTTRAGPAKPGTESQRQTASVTRAGPAKPGTESRRQTASVTRAGPVKPGTESRRQTESVPRAGPVKPGTESWGQTVSVTRARPVKPGTEPRLQTGSATRAESVQPEAQARQQTESARRAESVLATSRRSGLPAPPKTAATANRPTRKARLPAPTPAVRPPPTTRATCRSGKDRGTRRRRQKDVRTGCIGGSSKKGGETLTGAR